MSRKPLKSRRKSSIFLVETGVNKASGDGAGRGFNTLQHEEFGGPELKAGGPERRGFADAPLHGEHLQ